MRTLFIQITVVILAINVVSFFYLPQVLWSLVIFGPLILLGMRDITQKSHSILRNYPVLGTHAFSAGRNPSGNVPVFCGI